MNISYKNIENIDLVSHDQYLQILEQLKKRSLMVILVDITDDDTQFDAVLTHATDTMRLLGRKTVSDWIGTHRSGRMKAEQYKFTASEEFFDYLKTLEGFFFNRKDEWKCDIVEITDFGYGDIAFIDKNNQLLFATTTHEGYACISKDLMAEKNNRKK